MIIEIKFRKDWGFYFLIKSRNGVVIARSDWYGKKSNCLRAIKKITGTVSWKVEDISCG